MTNEPQNWTGEERRSLPIHVLNYIDKRLSEHNDILTGKIDAVQQEVFHLTQSINSFMEKQDDERTRCKLRVVEQCEKMIDEAIPHHPDNPQATPSEKRHEHRKAHAKWIDQVNAEIATFKRIKEEVIKWAVVSGCGIVVMATWQWVIKGGQ